MNINYLESPVVAIPVLDVSVKDFLTQSCLVSISLKADCFIPGTVVDPSNWLKNSWGRSAIFLCLVFSSVKPG